MTTQTKKPKTYKRETSWAMLLFVGYLAYYGQVEELAILSPFVFFFTAGAFGMDWASKQTKLVNKEGPKDG